LGQALFDLALVTTVVHVTGGPESQFPALYVLVIAVSAVLMPLSSSLLITTLAIVLYVADVVWQAAPVTGAIGLQIAVFVGVFLAMAFIANRARVAGVERQELVQEVRRLKLEASDILKNIRSGIVTVDGDGILLYTNPAALELLGIGESDILGRPLVEVLAGRSSELWDVIVTTQRLRLKTQRTEGYVRAGEKSFPIGVTTTALDLSDEGPATVTAIFSDISGQKRIEELHLRNGRLEAVAELSASLAHEIKNPLASIRSSVEQLARSDRASNDERFLADLVLRESDRLNRLLNEFLDFSRVHVVASRPLDLVEVATGAVDVVRRHPDCSSDIAIEVAGTSAPIDGDEDLLHRVIVNLVLNAVQASGGRAQIRVEIRPPDVTDVPRGMPFETAVMLKVIDDGPGVPRELADKLFDPFVTGRVGGTGLGLAIVQRAVQAHRGSVWVDSTPGEGTAFTLLLPAKGVLEVAA
jgi:two-component system sensor histidine kinase PilS (NtrC family)